MINTSKIAIAILVLTTAATNTANAANLGLFGQNTYEVIVPNCTTKNEYNPYTNQWTPVESCNPSVMELPESTQYVNGRIIPRFTDGGSQVSNQNINQVSNQASIINQAMQSYVQNTPTLSSYFPTYSGTSYYSQPVYAQPAYYSQPTSQNNSFNPQSLISGIGSIFGNLFKGNGSGNSGSNGGSNGGEYYDAVDEYVPGVYEDDHGYVYERVNSLGYTDDGLYYGNSGDYEIAVYEEYR